MAALKGMGHPDMLDYRFEIMWNGGKFEEVLLVETKLQTRKDQPDYDEERLISLVGFLNHYKDTLEKIGFLRDTPIVFRTVKA